MTFLSFFAGRQDLNFFSPLLANGPPAYYNENQATRGTEATPANRGFPGLMQGNRYEKNRQKRMWPE